MLPESRQLLQLTGLSTSLPCGAADLDLLACSCSHLQELCMCCTAGLELTALLQLTMLTSLWLLNVADSSSVASVAQLSGLQGLQRLGIMAFQLAPCIIDDSMLASLAVLTQLKQLLLPREDGDITPAMQQELPTFSPTAIRNGAVAHGCAIK